MNKPSSFFEKLQCQLPKTAYTDRYLQELEDHIEDAVDDARLQGTSEDQAQTEAFERLGDANVLHEAFRRAVVPPRLSFELDIFLVSLFLIPFYAVGIWIAAREVSEVIASRGVLVPSLAELVFEVTIFSGAIFLFFCLYYLFTLPRLLAWPGRAVSLWGLFARLQAIVFFGFALIGGILFSAGGSSELTVAQILMLVYVWSLSAAAFFAIIYFLHWRSRRMIQRGMTRLFQPMSSGWKSAGFFAGAVIAVFAVGGAVAMWWVESQGVGIAVSPPAIVSVFLFRGFFDFVFRILSLMSVSWLPRHVSVWAHAALFVGIMVLIATSVILHLYRAAGRRVPWIRLGLVVYLLTFFTLPTGVPHVEWRVPAVELSRVMETQQLGPLYRLVKALNRNESWIFHYQILERDGAFEIIQNTGGIYRLSEIQSVSTYRIQRRSVDEKIAGGALFGDIPEGFRCVNRTVPDRFFFPPEPVPGAEQNLMEAGQRECHELWYRDQQLFEQDDPRTIEDIELSSDGRWMLLVMYTAGVYEPNTVFLVDLRSI